MLLDSMDRDDQMPETRSPCGQGGVSGGWDTELPQVRRGSEDGPALGTGCEDPGRDEQLPEDQG